MDAAFRNRGRAHWAIALLALPIVDCHPVTADEIHPHPPPRRWAAPLVAALACLAVAFWVRHRDRKLPSEAEPEPSVPAVHHGVERKGRTSPLAAAREHELASIATVRIASDGQPAAPAAHEPWHAREECHATCREGADATGGMGFGYGHNAGAALDASATFPAGIAAPLAQSTPLKAAEDNFTYL